MNKYIKEKVNKLQFFSNKLKIIKDLKNVFDFGVNSDEVNLFLKSEYNDINNSRFITFDKNNIKLQLSDINSLFNNKKINLHVGNTLINVDNYNSKIKNIRVTCNDISIYLEDSNYVNYENVYIKTNGNVIIGAVDVQNNLTIIANEIMCNKLIDVNAKNQCYTAKKMLINYGFLDANNIIKINANELSFFKIGIFANELDIYSDKINFSSLIDFNLDHIKINSKSFNGDNSLIKVNEASINIDDCSGLDINIKNKDCKYKKIVKKKK